MSIVMEKGINDMPRGWTKKNDWNERVYKTWYRMFYRVYSEKFHEKEPTYVTCTLQLELHWLSYFVDHIEDIAGYDYKLFMDGKLQLDKDIKSNGQNKEYSIENCMFVSQFENTKQSHKTRDYECFKGENNPFYGKTHSEEMKSRVSELNGIPIDLFKEDGTFIKTYPSAKKASEELNVNVSHIRECCKFQELNCNKNEWFKKYKTYPLKTAGKFKNGEKMVWRYFKKS